MQVEQFKTAALRVGEFSDGKLRPVQLFRGALGMGAIRANLGILLAMSAAETSTRQEVVKYSIDNPDDIHLVGKHHAVQSGSLAMFIARLYCAPQIMPMLDGRLREYLDWFSANNRILHYQLIPISPEAVRTGWDWRRVKRIPKERATVPPVMEFPFIRSQPGPEHELIMAVHNAVPKTLGGDLRSDLCQDLIVKVLSGEIALANIHDEAAKHMRSCRKQYQARYNDVYLGDMRWDKKTWGETL